MYSSRYTRQNLSQNKDFVPGGPPSSFHLPLNFRRQSPESYEHDNSARDTHNVPFSLVEVSHSPPQSSHKSSQGPAGYGLPRFHSHGDRSAQLTEPLEHTKYPAAIPIPDPMDAYPRHLHPPARTDAWLASLPPPADDSPNIRHTTNVPIPSFEHSGIATSSSQYPYNPPYAYNQVPSWKELQYSGEFRCKELDDRVIQPTFVSVRSRGSGHSFASGKATRGSMGGEHEHVVVRCEFCGQQSLLSQNQEHWLCCEHRLSQSPSRNGVWIR